MSADISDLQAEVEVVREAMWGKVAWEEDTARLAVAALADQLRKGRDALPSLLLREERIAALAAENDKLREVLSIYADRANWRVGGPLHNAIGDRYAREALASTEASG